MNWYREVDGVPVLCSIIEASRADMVHVAETTFEGRRYSTVFLRLDHAYDGGTPILYETMVFGADEEFQCRYRTREDALDGHIRKLMADGWRGHPSEIQGRITSRPEPEAEDTVTRLGLLLED